MKNKQIQEERIKGYFIEATKSILKGEGLKSISVRNIADQAGYSYATLYNYFKDVNELVFECVKDFQQECVEMVASETKELPLGTGRIKAIAKSYVKYFIQYPGIFELFFIEKPTRGQDAILELINTFFDRLCSEDWEYCIAQKLVFEQSTQIIKPQLNYILTGIMIFYINRRHPSNYQELMQTLEKQLSHILP
ncbi:TetR/AcrR family transcriptional regulator [Chitinophagaceae bacterium LWZ2-11]